MITNWGSDSSTKNSKTCLVFVEVWEGKNGRGDEEWTLYIDAKPFVRMKHLYRS